jgi:hypothetical protein
MFFILSIYKGEIMMKMTTMVMEAYSKVLDCTENVVEVHKTESFIEVLGKIDEDYIVRRINEDGEIHTYSIQKNRIQ